MAQFELIRNEIEQAGAQLVYIAAEKRDGMFKPEKYMTEHPVSFPFLLDEDRSVTKAYGLYHWLGTDAINIAHPATLVIDRYGMVRFIYRGENQMDRIPTTAILEVLKRLPV
jgi:peroxiredoxin